ncbi:MAG: antitoxin MazE family protein [Bifidobacteriaceae bacterium]|nr:antitoxin MazE family protein [Bifidobacteriaceae bacterium]
MTAVQRQSARRERLRKQELRPIQVWVADTRGPEAAERLRRQCRMLAGDPHESEVLDWIEAVQDAGEDWQ